MHGRFEKPRGDDSSVHQKIGFGFLVLPVFIVIALIALTVIQPSTSNWISEAVQAEFIGDTAPPEQSPTQLAQPTAPDTTTVGGPKDRIQTSSRQR
jgi:hypothetical protein